MEGASMSNTIDKSGLSGLSLAVTILSDKIHERNVKAGWYKEVEGVDKESAFVKLFVGTKIALVHSEVSEGLEGYRKNLMDDHLKHRKMIEVEMADAVIRILDLAGYLDLDIGGAILEKLEYNARREDHKPENREKENGKSF